MEFTPLSEKEMLEELLTFVENLTCDCHFITHIIYDSEIYEKLLDAETGLYRESPSYVYGLLQDELNFGHIVQAEV